MTSCTRVVVRAVALAWLATPLPQTLAAQQRCPPTALVDAGWTAYRANRLDDARNSFRTAVANCPDDPAALTGLGYAELRLGSTAEANRLFLAALERRPDNIDALLGTGLIAWRENRLADAASAF